MTVMLRSYCIFFLYLLPIIPQGALLAQTEDKPRPAAGNEWYHLAWRYNKINGEEFRKSYAAIVATQ